VTARPTPLLGDVSLEYVQSIEHHLDGGFRSTSVVALPGELQQRAARRSHRIRLAGMLFGATAADDLATLQNAAAAGAELTFSADISTALDLQKVVITRFGAREEAGRPDRISYQIDVAESPPLPPPAEVESFGGLDDFGLGDLGIDTSVLDDIGALADEIGSAVDQAISAVSQLGALAAGLGDLGNAAGLLQPFSNVTSGLGEIGGALGKATGALGTLLGSA
jgi:hypothetical protein